MFKLPQDVLRKIFQFDPTYKELFQKNLLNDFHAHRWNFWKKAFLKHLRRCEYMDLYKRNVLNDLPTHVRNFRKKAFSKRVYHEIKESSTFHKLDFLLTYILDNWDITCFRENDLSKLYPTDIVMLLNYKNMAYSNGTIIADSTGSDDVLYVKITFDNCPRTFEACVRTRDEAVNYYRTTSESDETQILIHSNSTYFIYQIFAEEYPMFDGAILPPFDD